MTTLVFLEHHGGELLKGSLGVLGKAATLGDDVAAAVVGSGVRDLAEQAGKFGAKKKPQDVVSLADLGVEPERGGVAGSRTEVYALAEPPARGDTLKIEDDGGGAQRIVEFLLERKAL